MALSSLLFLSLIACLEKDQRGPGDTADTALSDADAGPGSGDGGDDTGWWNEDSGDDTGWWNGSDDGGDSGDAGDADDDGWTIDDGDCDDADADVHPGADESSCDGDDDDCDGSIDEGFDSDDYEPNDVDGYNLGDMGTEGDEVLLSWLWPQTDEDRFLFYVEDGDWSWFDIEIWLYDVPEHADYGMELRLVEDIDGDYIGVVGSADESSDGGDELVEYGGSTGFDDSGWYEVVVYSTDGASCDAPYTLQVLVGSW